MMTPTLPLRVGVELVKAAAAARLPCQQKEGMEVALLLNSLGSTTLDVDVGEAPAPPGKMPLVGKFGAVKCGALCPDH